MPYAGIAAQRTYASGLGSTGNLWRHMKSEHPSLLDIDICSPDQCLSKGILAIPYSDEGFRACLLHWIVVEAMPFTAIEAPFFHMIVRMLS